MQYHWGDEEDAVRARLYVQTYLSDRHSRGSCLYTTLRDFGIPAPIIDKEFQVRQDAQTKGVADGLAGGLKRTRSGVGTSTDVAGAGISSCLPVCEEDIGSNPCAAVVLCSAGTASNSSSVHVSAASGSAITSACDTATTDATAIPVDSCVAQDAPIIPAHAVVASDTASISVHSSTTTDIPMHTAACDSSASGMVAMATAGTDCPVRGIKACEPTRSSPVTCGSTAPSFSVSHSAALDMTSRDKVASSTSGAGTDTNEPVSEGSRKRATSSTDTAAEDTAHIDAYSIVGNLPVNSDAGSIVGNLPVNSDADSIVSTPSVDALRMCSMVDSASTSEIPAQPTYTDRSAVDIRPPDHHGNRPPDHHGNRPTGVIVWTDANVEKAVALIFSWIHFQRYMDDTNELRSTRTGKRAHLAYANEAERVQKLCGKQLEVLMDTVQSDGPQWSVALNVVMDLTEDVVSPGEWGCGTTRGRQTQGSEARASGTGHGGGVVDRLERAQSADGVDTGMVVANDAEDRPKDGSHVVVLDNFFSEAERIQLMDVLHTPGWDKACGPNPAHWERMTCDAAGLAPTWGLKQHMLDRLLGEDTLGPPPGPILAIQTRLTQLYPDYRIRHIPHHTSTEHANYSSHPFVGNATVHGDHFEWHVDADPVFLPGHGHQNRTRGKPYFVTLMLYLNDEWLSEWKAETEFLDLTTNGVVSVQPKPRRAVLMDQDISHRASAPSAAAGTRARYSLVWKLIFLPKHVDKACSIAHEDFGPVNYVKM
ncbi:hypothetical protein SARC_00671 [Sphaeroforma arctica JP610]|uniref:Prolyl 4-hydroxylase alpha subunit Fe(2+) 2OG dioxygenase domain-containing protein n=1 Tax=Sphaeroforma arctica JP610 TaxID=667725 RepID=A0A0L0GE73_9EUKA|nr:hypothetical protein SARC_00671 [Sphaeroforma arctica JP610]KNC87194.1 hypothetical protein SARC_00671 [Sphaeroforma arctica JP610]|eukprot:XP_014161096.1 hypothetical protein SARC_00671 [Sphaeroforma arctica JP610]